MTDKQIVVQAFKDYYRENSHLKLDVSKIDNRYIKFSDRHEDNTRGKHWYFTIDENRIELGKSMNFLMLNPMKNISYHLRIPVIYFLQNGNRRNGEPNKIDIYFNLRNGSFELIHRPNNLDVSQFLKAEINI